MKFDNSDSLGDALRADVDEYFRSGHANRRDSPRMWIKTTVILLWFFGSYALLLFGHLHIVGNILTAISLGLATAGIGFNVMHDGCHGSFSRSPGANRWLGRTLDMLGGSSYVWRHQHNRAHHTFTNVAGHDEDIEMGALIRLSPNQPLMFHHRFQFIYIWFLYALLVPKWVFVDDYVALGRGQVGTTKMRFPRGSELAVFVGGKLLSGMMIFGLPLLLHPARDVLPLFALWAAVAGVVLAVVFQLAHAVTGTEFPTAEGVEPARSFARHQLATTADFAPRNRLLTWYVGGLNFQIEHHLFPRIAHSNYPALASIVRARATEAGAPYLIHDTFFAAIRAHHRHLVAMGRAPRVVEPPTVDALAAA